MSHHRPRLRRDAPARVPFVLQPRDVEIVRAVHDFRVLTSRQIPLLVAGSPQRIVRRLQALYHHGYLDRIKVSDHEPLAYALADYGADLLEHVYGIPRGKIRWSRKNLELKPYMLPHTFMIGHVRATLIRAIRGRSDLDLAFWVGENELRHHVVVEGNGYRQETAPVVPDGYFGLTTSAHDGSEDDAYFFLECDTGSMELARFRMKMAAYRAFWKDGLHRAELGIDHFRVLSVAHSATRRDHLRDVTQEIGGAMFWFAAKTDIDLVNPETILQPIWRTARQGDDTFHTLLE
jgi:hypothetical protein